MKTKTNKTKTAASMLAIFVIGMYLMAGFASALSLSTDINANAVAKAKVGKASVSLEDAQSDFDEEARTNFNVREASHDIDESVSAEARESTFAQVSIGQGWVISSDDSNDSEGSEGSFARISWVEKTFIAASDDEENETNNTNEASVNETTKARGTLKIGSTLYKLTLNENASDEDTMVFDVVSEKGKIIGTLTLESEVSLVGFTVWSGTLELDSGQSYEIHVATRNTKVKGTGSAEIQAGDEDKQPGFEGNINASEKGQGQKLGLFARIRAFFGSGGA